MSDAKHGESCMQAQARLLPVPTNTPDAVVNITRRAAFCGLTVSAAILPTAAGAADPIADLVGAARDLMALHVEGVAGANSVRQADGSDLWSATVWRSADPESFAACSRLSHAIEAVAPGMAGAVLLGATLAAPDDADLLALCHEFHKLSAEIERLGALPMLSSQSDETPEQLAAWAAQNAVADQVAGTVPATLAGFFAKLSVVMEDHAGSGDIPASLMLRMMEEGHAVAGLPCPPLERLRIETALEHRLNAGGAS